MPKDTRLSLLNAAERLACGLGFDGFSYADLEAEVGIRKASIHYHFPTKGDMSFALLSRYQAVFLNRLTGISMSHSQASGCLLAFLDLYRQALDNGRSLCLCVALSVTQRALPDASKMALDQFHRDVTAWLEGIFRAGLHDGTILAVNDPRAEARAALAQVEGAQIVARASSDLARFEAAIDTLRARAI